MLSEADPHVPECCELLSGQEAVAWTPLHSLAVRWPRVLSSASKLHWSGYAKGYSKIGGIADERRAALQAQGK
jgi:hypothetical protein